MTKAPITRIAITFLGAGSAYGNGATEEDAVRICWANAKDFAKAMGGFKREAEIPIHVFDYEPYNQIKWQDGVVYGHVEKGDKGVPLTRLGTHWFTPKGFSHYEPFNG